MIEVTARIADTLLFGLLVVAVAGFTSFRALLYKRDPRAAIAWVGFIWFVPLIGSLFYWLFGVNRIARKARGLRTPPAGRSAARASMRAGDRAGIGSSPAHLRPLERLVNGVSPYPLAPGNRLELLIDGEEAYPAMLEAIESAERSVTLATYIFDCDPVGIRFADALERARARGVAVRVLIDGVGRHYSYPTIERELQRRSVPTALFLPTWIPSRLPYLNLRNHRKLLVIDGALAFTGGMNIRRGHELRSTPVDEAIRDVHVRLRGPVVAHLQNSFAQDWAFCTDEELGGESFFPGLEWQGSDMARGIPDGPDGEMHSLAITLQCALALARERVRIVTPYFLPNEALLAALEVAAMRGVGVEIVLPEKGNLSLVRWAMSAQLWQVLQRGCRVHLTPAPFDHSKLTVVDDVWTLIGSANWDSRSLRLNFELNVECYGRNFSAAANRLIDERIAGGRETSLAEVDARPLPIRLRDGVARLASPYL